MPGLYTPYAFKNADQYSDVLGALGQSKSWLGGLNG